MENRKQPEAKQILEVEGKLTLNNHFDTAEAAAQKLYNLFYTENSEHKLKSSISYRQYFDASDDIVVYPDEYALIFKPKNPDTVYLKKKSPVDKDAEIHKRNEEEHPHSVPPVDAENTGAIKDTIKGLAKRISKEQMINFQEVGPLMRKDRWAFTISDGMHSFKVTFDSLYASDSPEGDKLDQIEIEYKGKQDKLSPDERQAVDKRIKQIQAFISDQMMKGGYAFNADSPSKAEWVAQHFGLKLAL